MIDDDDDDLDHPLESGLPHFQTFTRTQWGESIPEIQPLLLIEELCTMTGYAVEESIQYLNNI